MANSYNATYRIGRQDLPRGTFAFHVFLTFSNPFAFQEYESNCFDLYGYHPAWTTSLLPRSLYNLVALSGNLIAQNCEEPPEGFVDNLPPDATTLVPDDDFTPPSLQLRDTFPTKLAVWWYQYFRLHLPVKSLILYGPRQVGKTTLARSLGPHSYFNNAWGLAAYNPTATYAVFDDFIGGLYALPFKHWLGQEDQVTMGNLNSTETISWGKPCIYIAKENPLDDKRLPKCEKEWLQQNTTVVFLPSPIF